MSQASAYAVLIMKDGYVMYYLIEKLQKWASERFLQEARHFLKQEEGSEWTVVIKSLIRLGQEENHM